MGHGVQRRDLELRNLRDVRSALENACKMYQALQMQDRELATLEQLCLCYAREGTAKETKAYLTYSADRRLCLQEIITEADKFPRFAEDVLFEKMRKSHFGESTILR